MTIPETSIPTPTPSAAPARPSGGLPAGRPDQRLRPNRTFRWTFQGLAIFMAVIFVVTILTGQLPGIIICGIASPLFWGMSRLFKREQLALYGSGLWERDILGRWHYPLHLDHLAHVAYVRLPGARSGIALLLQATPSRPFHGSAASREEPPERTEMRLAVSDYGRRRLERLIAPWVAGHPGIAGEELSRLLELRTTHPRTAGIRSLFSRGR